MAHDSRPREYDTKCPDGFTCYGWRRVNKGGYVRFSHGQHFHDDLLPLVGKYVYVTLADMWGSEVDIWPEKPWQKGTDLRGTNPALEAVLKNQNDATFSHKKLHTAPTGDNKD